MFAFNQKFEGGENVIESKQCMCVILNNYVSTYDNTPNINWQWVIQKNSP